MSSKEPSAGVPWWVTAASIVLVPVVVTLITQYVSAAGKWRELDIRMVEIALSLVYPDPNKEPSSTGARVWAVDVMQKYSGVPLTEEARKSIIANPVSIDKQILNPQPVPAPPTSAPPYVPIGGLDNIVILDDPQHTSKWTKADGSLIDFSEPVRDVLIKAAVPGIRLLGGHVRTAYMGSASMGVDFVKYLRSLGTRVETGTCFRLITPYQERYGGLLLGKVEEAACP